MIERSVAMSLYIYNVSPSERAKKLYDEFEGACAEMDELLRWVDLPYWATEMPFPTAYAYMKHAMEKYGDEATRRCMTEAIGNAILDSKG